MQWKITWILFYQYDRADYCQYSHRVLPARPHPMRRYKIIQKSCIPRFSPVLLSTCLSFGEYACIVNLSFVCECSQRICIFWDVDYLSIERGKFDINRSVHCHASKPNMHGISQVQLTSLQFFSFARFDYTFGTAHQKTKIHSIAWTWEHCVNIYRVYAIFGSWHVKNTTKPKIKLAQWANGNWLTVTVTGHVLMVLQHVNIAQLIFNRWYCSTCPTVSATQYCTFPNCLR